MRVDIFCESGQEYGLGHFYRCIKLIHLCLAHPQITTITLHNRGDFTPPPLHSLVPNTLHINLECKCYEWLTHAHPEFDLVFIDSYEAQRSFYQAIQERSQALICLDDTFRDVYPSSSIILNPAPDAKAHFPNCYENLWCGIEYMIRPQTPEDSIPQPQQAPIDPAPTHHKLFLSFGGVDHSNLTQATLNALESHILSQPSILMSSLHIVLGDGYPHTLHIPKSLQNHTFVYHNLSPRAFLALAQSCDFALSAGGGSMLELLALRIPSVIVQSASNQQFQITQYAAMGAILPAYTLEDSLQSLFTLLDKGEMYQALSHTLYSLELGTLLPQAFATLIESLKPYPLPKRTTQSTLIQAIDFCSLTQEQSQLVWTIRNHQNTAKWMYSQHISQQMHRDFLHRLTEDQTRKYWLIYCQDQALGVGSLTRINLSHHHAFIGIYKNPLCPESNKGLQILRFLESVAFEELELHALHLEVLKHNTQALRFYEKMGYKQEGHLTQFIHRDGRYYDVILMYKTRDML